MLVSVYKIINKKLYWLQFGAWLQNKIYNNTDCSFIAVLPFTASSHVDASDRSASTSSRGYFAPGQRFFNGAIFSSFLVDRTVPRTFSFVESVE